MNNISTEQRSLGDDLLDKGWQQGTLFNAPSISFCWNAISPSDSNTSELTQPMTRKVKQGEKLIIITQDCDIKVGEDKEPYIEALLCKPYKKKFLEKVSKTSARWFVVDFDKGLVAEAKYRVQIAKQVLSRLTPETWPNNSYRLDNFIRWLARRYDRPAMPDVMVEVFQKPIENKLALISEECSDTFANFNKVVHEIRVNIPQNEIPPFDLHLVLIVNPEGLSREEADAIDYVIGSIKECLDLRLVHLDEDIRVLTEDEITLREHRATRPMYLDYYTYKGEEPDGAKPFDNN